MEVVGQRHVDRIHLRPPGRLRMMTIRSEGQFNTVVYEEQDIYRGQERREQSGDLRLAVLEMGLAKAVIQRPTRS